MLGFINKAVGSIFGTKSDRDLKDIYPIVAQINTEYQKLSTLSNDELRQKTNEFKTFIAQQLDDTNTKIETLKQEAENLPDDQIDQKNAYYKQIDEHTKQKDQRIEQLLNGLLPQAFAVVKETAKRFKENETISVSTTDFDKDLALRRPSVTLQGNQTIYAKRWMAAGTQIVWDMLHYDVQLIGGIILHRGKIAEMGTGEGKTLVATLPAYLNALAAQGVHVVTVNDYLAKRDSEWIGMLFEFHGLRVDCIDKHQPNSPQRRNAYLADITYGTNNEFGFDYLRDNMATSPEDLVQRKHHFAMVDEVDSVLIDDARTPLIIAGSVGRDDSQQFIDLKPRIEKLVKNQEILIRNFLNDAKKAIEQGKNDEAGLPLLRASRGLPKYKPTIKFLSETGIRALYQKTEANYLQDQAKEMRKIVDPELYFVIDEKNNQIDLTQKGIDLITSQGEDQSFFILTDVGSEIADIEQQKISAEEKFQLKEKMINDFSVKSERIHTINQLLKAYTLFEKDVEYIIDENKVKIVDEQTGRVMDGRRYSDGLHQAIEAKENVKIEEATQTFATVTLQNYFRMYHKLCGMTGTAETEASEFWEIYKLDVVSIPTNKKVVREDKEDLIYKTKKEKYNAVIDEIQRLREAGRPTLVGTTSVEVSELLSRMLRLRNLPHQVLNAKLHQKEADIILNAGLSGTVTIATNMAGRGTDIKLGQGVKEAGGLAIIGTERHESRRVDRQLRGRSGRQGDTGSSQFFVSLEDDLMRLFGSERVAWVMDKSGHKEGEYIQSSMITTSIERAQKKVEENNFGTRKRLLEYDDVMNYQREAIYKKRRHALFGERIKVDIADIIYDVSDTICQNNLANTNYLNFKLETIKLLALDSNMSQQDFDANSRKQNNTTSNKLYQEAMENYYQKNEKIAEFAYKAIKNIVENPKNQYINIIIPIHIGGDKGINVISNLEKGYQTNGKEVVNDFERMATLSVMDDYWKHHLRDMDELKQNVQNATYEQKDPLVIYKKESFDLFRAMLNEMNTEIVQTLMHGKILVEQEQTSVQQQTPKNNTQKQQYVTSRTDDVEDIDLKKEQQNQIQRQQPLMRIDPKIGRNDPCFCGSGKKYKQCHGKNLL